MQDTSKCQIYKWILGAGSPPLSVASFPCARSISPSSSASAMGCFSVLLLSFVSCIAPSVDSSEEITGRPTATYSADVRITTVPITENMEGVVWKKICSNAEANTILGCRIRDQGQSASLRMVLPVYRRPLFLAQPFHAGDPLLTESNWRKSERLGVRMNFHA